MLATTSEDFFEGQTEVPTRLRVFQDLEGTFQRCLGDIQHMSNHTPAHMPWSKPSPR